MSIVPIREVTDALVTEEFRVSPTFISVIPGKTITPQDAKTFLEASGITFPPGSSATYLSSKGKLVIRNTQENLDLTEVAGSGKLTVRQPPCIWMAG